MKLSKLSIEDLKVLWAGMIAANNPSAPGHPDGYPQIAKRAWDMADALADEMARRKAEKHAADVLAGRFDDPQDERGAES